MFWNLTTAAPTIISSLISKVTPNMYVYNLMAIWRVLQLILGQNSINPRLLQSTIASIWKDLMVKKSCVIWCSLLKIITALFGISISFFSIKSVKQIVIESTRRVPNKGTRFPQKELYQSVKYLFRFWLKYSRSV